MRLSWKGRSHETQPSRENKKKKRWRTNKTHKIYRQTSNNPPKQTEDAAATQSEARLTVLHSKRKAKLSIIIGL